MADETEPDVIVVEPDEEPFTHKPTEHRLLDVEYQHEPATGGLDYPAPGAEEGVLTDEEEAAPKSAKSSRKSE